MFKSIYKIKKISISLGLIAFLVFQAKAQPAMMSRNRDPYKWMFGLSWNVVNDNEEKFANLLDISRSWNGLYYPSRFFVDRYLRNGWSWEAAIAYNQYKTSKIINDSTGRSGLFFSGDVNVKYSYNHLLKRNKWFDPYYSFGLGVTYRTALSNPLTPTLNGALGSNFWFSKKWGAQVQIAGKLALASDIYVSKNDYFQCSLGIVYRKHASRKSNHFNNKKHRWTHDKQKFKRKNT